MVPSNSLAMIWRIAVNQYIALLRSSKMIVLGVVLVFIQIQIITPIIQCSELMQMKVSVFEPFIAMGNSSVLLLILPLLFLVLMADFPPKGGNHLLYQFRCKKRTWLWGQLLYLMQICGSIILFFLLVTIALLGKQGKFLLNFSEAITHYVVTFPERYGDYINQLFPENLYLQLTLQEAVIHTILFLILYFILLGLILLLMSLINKKNIGIIIDCFVVILGVFSCAGGSTIKWMFPMAHAIPWLHFEAYFSEQIFPMWGSYVYFLVIILVLGTVCFSVVKRYEVGRGTVYD